MSARRRVALVAAVAVAALLVSAAPALAKAKDSNHNGIPNWWESKHHLSKTKNQAKSDFDHDGLNNLTEYRASTNPRSVDTDHDGVHDGVEDRDKDGLVNIAEVRSGTNVASADTDRDGVKDPVEDPDNDGLDNADEWDCRTNPRAADSDRDGVKDCDEDADHDGLDNEAECDQGCDPRDADSDDDGEADGAEIGGVVAAFDATTGELSLTPFKDGSAVVTVTVDASTTISWDDDEGGAAEPTVADLVAGAHVHEIEVVVQPDGSLLAKSIELRGASDCDDDETDD